MDERKTTRLTESTPEQPVQTDARKMLEQAFARGSGHLSDVPSEVVPERSENSVMEGLPPAKAERIAAMRRELADLQRQLSEAQQRIATELQGRAEDAERVEALEARVQAQDAKALADTARTAELATEIANLESQLSSVAATDEELRREIASRDAQLEEVRGQHRAVAEELGAQSSSLYATKTLLETRDGELAARTAERDTAQATQSRLERELEDQRKQHGEATSQLELQFASLRDANALIATRDAELTKLTSELDALKVEVAAARAKVRDVASHLTRLGQDLIDGVGGTQTISDSEPNHAVTARSVKPPPLPPSRTAAHTVPPPVETILELTEEPRSRSRSGLMLIGGVVLGCVATIGVVKWSGSSTAGADERQLGASPAPALAVEHVSEPASPPTLPATSASQPTPISDTEVKRGPNDESDSRPAPPAEITTDGVIVLPQEAADHRVFVDGRVVPVKNLRAVVPCGTREVRIGSRGTSRTVDVACGRETTVPTDPRDR